MTVDNTDDAAQLNKVISAAREDKLVTKDNIGGQLTDYAKVSDLSAKADANDVYSKTDAENTFATKTELGSYATRTELDAKANTDLSNLTADGENKIKNTMSADMNLKADKTTVDTVAGKVTALETTVGDASSGLVKDVADLRNQGNDLNNALGSKANKSDLDEANAKITDLQAKTAKLSDDGTALTDMTTVSGTTVSGTNVEAGALKVKGEISNGAGVTTTLADIKGSMTQTAANKDAIDTLQTTTNGQQTAIDKLNEKTAEISHADGGGTKISGVTIKDGNIVGNGNSAITQLANVETDKIKTDSINGKSLTGTTVATAKDVEDAVKAETDERTAADTALEGKITKNSGDITDLQAKDTELANKIQTNEGNIETNKNAIAATDKRTGGITRNDAANETKIEGNVTVDNLGNVTAKGQLTGKGVDAGAGAITTTGAVNAGSLIVTDASNLKGDVTMDKKLSVTGDTLLKKTDVDGALNVTGESSLKNTTVGGTLGVTGATTLSGELKAEKDATFEKDVTVKGTTNLGNTTVEGDLKVTGTITTDKMVFGDKAHNNYTEIDQGKVTSKNSVVNGEGQLITSSSIFNAEENKVGFANNATGDQSFHKQTSDVIMDNVKDRDNSNNRTQTKTETKDIITDENGNSSTTSQTASENKTYLTDKDGKNTNSTIDTAKGYDKTIKGENGETSTKQDELNITNTAQNGTITNEAKDIVNTATTMKTTVTGKATESYGELETTVDGQATENFNNGLNTTVTGTEKHTVNGKQINTVTEGQENIISGGQTNTITGGQINNITGDQTTTITGNKTETVEGKVTENFKNGQETNVTGDQVIKVSGTQTTTATDINRNASSGMIDTIDNDYGTNTETKVAGKTTTDVSIKGTGEKGQYIRGANESRDYLIKGTLKNSETKTAEATSTEITDGNGKTSATIQDVNNLAGSVTNGTETGVSGIHANDNSVSIDSIVTDGNKYSVINQKKGSIQSTVVDGTNSTVILQDKDNVTIASSNDTVGLVGKDIVNKAQDTITNTAGTSITNQVKDSKVTTDVDGTTFENKTAAVSDGGTTTTKINGNRITTGRVDANELGVSDKDGANTADLSVKAGEGVKASAGNGTTTGSLDVKADEVVSSVKDADGKGSTFKQRIDAIMMESKNVSIKAEETLTNEAKDIVTNASNSITEKVGENNVTKKTTTSSISEIQNADTITSVQQTENMVQSYVGKKDGSATNVTTNFANASANMVTQDGQTSTVLNNKDGLLVRNTANGSSFITADGTNTGAALEWTNVKGNEISTGKVEANYVKMDYADVMKDLGVRGNAKVDKNLEVGGTSTLKGDVTMESNAKVKKDLTVEGTTTTKTLKVTENAEIDGTLKVTKKATFEDSVAIAKDLSVGGDVTAKSYKVGDKTYISAAGINANNQKITNVADGSISEGSKDAVNGGQLYGVKNDLEGKVNKVGANAAAMANLHPMEFDPDSKWNIAAAIGNYGSETAAALGAFYRPNDNVMVNLSTAFGTGENMVGGGVSVRLGKGGNKLSREETNALKAQVADLTARMDALLSVLNPNMSKDFPDVPENHWAYEAVSRLAGNDIVQGYPDGEFHGERTMTRYEMAEIIYNALSRGAEAEKELVEEFKPELQAMAASEKATAERAEG